MKFSHLKTLSILPTLLLFCSMTASAEESQSKTMTNSEQSSSVITTEPSDTIQQPGTADQVPTAPSVSTDTTANTLSRPGSDQSEMTQEKKTIIKKKQKRGNTRRDERMKTESELRTSPAIPEQPVPSQPESSRPGVSGNVVNPPINPSTDPSSP